MSRRSEEIVGLSPDLIEEAEFMERSIDEMCAKATDRKTVVRVQRMRQGATVEASKFADWWNRELSDAEEDEGEGRVSTWRLVDISGEG